MYAYFIDDWVYDSAYRKQRDALDLALTQRGITGRKIRLGRLSDVRASIADCRRTGVRTFVAVGGDTTASRLLNALLDVSEKIDETIVRERPTLGIIPMREENSIARSFFIADMRQGADALARHTTRAIDLGSLNKRHYFITAALFPQGASLGFPSYKVSSLRREHAIAVCNINIFQKEKKDALSFSPSDGTLKAVIGYSQDDSFFQRLSGGGRVEEYEIESVFPITQIEIHSPQKTMRVLADTEKTLTAPVSVRVAPRSVDIVVGLAVK